MCVASSVVHRFTISSTVLPLSVDGAGTEVTTGDDALGTVVADAPDAGTGVSRREVKLRNTFAKSNRGKPVPDVGDGFAVLTSLAPPKLKAAKGEASTETITLIHQKLSRSRRSTYVRLFRPYSEQRL